MKGSDLKIIRLRLGITVVDMAVELEGSSFDVLRCEAAGVALDGEDLEKYVGALFNLVCKKINNERKLSMEDERYEKVVEIPALSDFGRIAVHVGDTVHSGG